MLIYLISSTFKHLKHSYTPTVYNLIIIKSLMNKKSRVTLLFWGSKPFFKMSTTLGVYVTYIFFS